MEQVSVVGLDLAKSVFQVHGVNAQGKAVLRRKLSRSQLLKLFGKMPPCLVGMEACASVPHWARELVALGHEVKLMPARYVKPYVKRGKTDAADAEAICEAATRPTMRFVAVKSVDQQAVLMLHKKIRDLLIRQRTALINALRAHLSEYGIVTSKGPGGVTALMKLFQEGRDMLPVHARSAMDAPDRCSSPQKCSCTAGIVHTWLNGHIIAHLCCAGVVHPITSDAAYDAHSLRHAIADKGAIAVIPSNPSCARKYPIDRQLYARIIAQLR